MRFVTFSTAALGERVGALVGDRVVDLLEASGDNPVFRSMLALAGSGPEGREIAAELCEDGGAGRSAGHDGPPSHALGDVRLWAPVPRPMKNVYCVGLNYRSHVEQNAAALGEPVVLPEVPLFFSKPVTAVIGPGQAVVHDSRLTHKLDYEVELAVVMGKKGTWIAPEDVYDHIFGFTIVNDVSARDLQWRTGQFLYGKGLDSFCPMGPAVVTVDEMPALDRVMLELLVNGELRQSETAGNMLFPPEVAIAELSRGITLEPGDVISLGTPGGCGYQSSPPVFLWPGDTVECRANAIGSLVNPVARAEGAFS
jgi:2-keto-4-pentenoate hydratase/2-oxohepta-3-ene-1,7-dioic acid hydratase in catechol pathway